MKYILSLFTAIFSCFFISSQLNAQDWPNLERYREANAQLKPLAADEHRIVFMGNSITEVWAADSTSFFQKNKNYVGRGISGQTTPQMLIRFRQDVVDLKPSVVLIMAGINDIAGNTGPSDIKMIADNIKSMAQIAEAEGIAVILCSVLPAFDFPWRRGLEPAGKVIDLNTRIQKFAKENGFIYLDYFTAMKDERNGLPSKYSYDEVHPTKEGYLVMEPLAVKAIEEALRRSITRE